MHTRAILLALTWMKTIAGNLKLTCKGHVTRVSGVFCFDGSRDVDLLVDSFLEMGIDAEFMLGSSPAPTVQVAPQYPPPTTTTTTLPPTRRRVASGWADSGASPCEDVNPSDAADSDCYAARYTNLTVNFMSRLNAISYGIYSTSDYNNKLGPYISSFQVPQLQESVGWAIIQGVPILNQTTSDALADLSLAIRQSRRDTDALITTLDGSADDSRVAIQSSIQRAFDSVNAVSVDNVNKLVTRANALNSRASDGSSEKVTKADSAILDGLAKVNFDEARILSLNNAIALALAKANTGLFYRESNLTTSAIPGLIGNLSKWITSWQANLTQSQVGQIDVNMTKTIDGDINGTIFKAKSILDYLISLKSNSSDSSLGGLWSLLAEARAGTASMSRSALSALRNVSTSLAKVKTSQYNVPIARLGNLFSFVNACADLVDRWMPTASIRLESLSSILSHYSDYLIRNMSQLSAKRTDGFQDSIQETITRVGQVQRKIESVMLDRQRLSIVDTHRLIKRIVGNSDSVDSMLSSIARAIRSLKSGGQRGDDPLFSVDPFWSSLDAAAQRVVDLARDVKRNLDSSVSNVSAWINGHSIGPSAYRITPSPIDNSTKDLDSLKSLSQYAAMAYSDITKRSVESQQAARNLVGGWDREATERIAEALSYIALKEESLGLNRLHIPRGGTEMHVPSGDMSYALDVVRSDVSNAMGKLQRSLESTIERYDQSITAELLDRVNQFLRKIITGGSGFRMQAEATEDRFTSSLSAFDASVLNELLKEFHAITNPNLEDEFRMEMSKLRNSLVDGTTSIQSINGTLPALAGDVQSLTRQTSQREYGNLKSTLALVRGALESGRILGRESDVLKEGIGDASRSFHESVGQLLNASLVVLNTSTRGEAKKWSDLRSAIFEYLEHQVTPVVAPQIALNMTPYKPMFLSPPTRHPFQNFNDTMGILKEQLGGSSRLNEEASKLRRILSDLKSGIAQVGLDSFEWFENSLQSADLSNASKYLNSTNAPLRTITRSESQTITSVQAVDRLIEEEASIRENTGKAVLNRIYRNQIEIAHMFAKAISGTSSNLRSSMNWDTGNITGNIGRLKAWASYASAEEEQIASLRKELSNGLEGEKLRLIEGLHEGASLLARRKPDLDRINSQMDLVSADVDDRVFRLNNLEDNLRSFYQRIDPRAELNLTDINNLTVPHRLLEDTRSSWLSTENEIDSWIKRANIHIGNH